MRYLGQNYEHEVEIDAGELDDAALERSFRRFDALHADRYGYQIDGEVIELVSFKVSAIGPRRDARPHARSNDRGRRAPAREVYLRESGFVDAAVVHRASLEPGESVAGPARVEEDGSTTLRRAGHAASSSALDRRARSRSDTGAERPMSDARRSTRSR